MSKPKDDFVVAPYTLWLFLLCTTRYAMGRRSAVVSEITETLIEYFRVLTLHQQLQIIREIQEELERSERLGTALGDQIDHELWVETVKQLKKKVHHASE